MLVGVSVDGMMRERRVLNSESHGVHSDSVFSLYTPAVWPPEAVPTRHNQRLRVGGRAGV